MDLPEPRAPFQPHPEDRVERDDDDLNTDDELGIQSDNEEQFGVKHDGPQTGVKGVRADARARAEALSQARKGLIAATVKEQERRALVTRAGLGGNIEREAEEERVRREREAKMGRGDNAEEEEDEDDVLAWREKRLAQLRSGGVREVSGEGFLKAVEREGWVLVVLHEPDVPRCSNVLAQASMLRDLTVVSAQASRIGFGLLPDDSTTTLDAEDSDDDADWSRLQAGSSSWKPGRVGKADPDVLPTVLAYRDGELARTWVRIDLEMTEGLEAFLKSEGVIGQVKCPISDDEDSDDY